ncbi:MAG: hypothetical protein A2X46_05905 [Lentisphaerae bacterium GWF2_57_35]|nr:MAG: hypothetical protein A2X46_05905 [Lentisphaerae bacterium GWF2_57_35]
MIIGLLHASMSIPESHSLKEKRMVLRSLKDRIRNEINVSIAEVGKQDIWQSTEIAVVTVSAEKSVVERRLSDVSRMLQSNPRVVMIDYVTQLL